MSGCHARAAYVPRTTQQCDAVTIVREHLPGFLERIETHGEPLPAFVRDELEAFTTCGNFEEGFLVAKCRRCGESLRVPFACKSRGICPSCMGRRMCETAALLVDHRLPKTRFRQWVLSFEGSMAVRLGYDKQLLSLVCKRFAHRVMQTLRRQAKREHGVRSTSALHPGVMLVVQRFRNDLGLFVHIHALVTDGCFEALPNGEARFHEVDLDERHLVRVLEGLHKDLAEHLADEPDPPDDATLACLQLGLPAPTLRALHTTPPAPKPMTASAFGMQLHAAVTTDGRDRRRLERMCRYLLRPAFAHDAVQAMPDGSVRVHFKQPTKTGATFAQMSRDTFLARLCALVPPPRANQILYYGVLANRHKLRPKVMPERHAPAEPKQLALFVPKDDLELAAITRPMIEDQVRDRAPSRLSWTRLLARVFSIDVSVCKKCGGPMRVIKAVLDPDEIAAELHGARAPPRPPPPGQVELFAG